MKRTICTIHVYPPCLDLLFVTFILLQVFSNRNHLSVFEMLSAQIHHLYLYFCCLPSFCRTNTRYVYRISHRQDYKAVYKVTLSAVFDIGWKLAGHAGLTAFKSGHLAKDQLVQEICPCIEWQGNTIFGVSVCLSVCPSVSLSVCRNFNIGHMGREQS
jgi:hypothetical protein